jgi:hypothetical protein
MDTKLLMAIKLHLTLPHLTLPQATVTKLHLTLPLLITVTEAATMM